MNLESKMKVFYINLEKSKDRKAHMEKMLSELNLDYERFEAICPTIKEIKFGKFKKFYERAVQNLKKYVKLERFHSKAIGAFGCYLSHLSIHESQLSNPEPYIILEDDIKLTKETFSLYKDFISNKVYKDWDIIRSIWYSNKEVVKIKGVHRNSKFSEKHETHNLYGGSHFCVFRNAKKIVNYLSSENVTEIDALYSTSLLNVYHSKFDVRTMSDAFETTIAKIEWKKNDKS